MNRMTASVPEGRPWQKFYRPIRARKTFEYVVESVVEGIERSAMRAGDALPLAKELAVQLDVSLPTLRQGLRVLERAGVLSVRPGASGGIFLLTDIIEYGAISRKMALEADSVHAVLEARRVTETAITQYSMLRCEPNDFEEIQRARDLMADNLGDPKMFRVADAKFHRAILHGTHNEVMIDIMIRLQRKIIPIQDAYINDLQADYNSLEIHTQQLTAMQECDSEKLGKALDRHFRILEEAFETARTGEGPEPNL